MDAPAQLPRPTAYTPLPARGDDFDPADVEARLLRYLDHVERNMDHWLQKSSGPSLNMITDALVKPAQAIIAARRHLAGGGGDPFDGEDPELAEEMESGFSI